MKRWFSIAILCSFSVLSFSQLSDLNSWFDLKRDASGHAVITGIVKNKSLKAQAFSYSMRLDKKAASGNVLSTQSGSFTLIPDEQKDLSQVRINLSETTSFEVILKIFDDERVVAEKKIQSDLPFLESFKKLLPQKPKATVTKKETKISHKKEILKIQNNTDALEIEGLILDETRSKIGRDFYDSFYGKWTPPVGATDFTITIKEMPARGRAARVAIEVNGNLVVQRMVQPRQEIIELLAEQAVNIVKSHLRKNETIKNDLEKGDQKGSGIF